MTNHPNRNRKRHAMNPQSRSFPDASRFQINAADARVNGSNPQPAGTAARSPRMSPEQRRLYDGYLVNPPQRAARALADGYWAGRDGIRGVRMGDPGSLQRAAWLAGDTARKARDPFAPEAR